ncbi:MAG: fumarylacetoacetate hydrolase family protein [Planctomycetes bacterium]|nr:fumarylacetoacetate hydrolase family protein [Planctomycetota bacterium]
MILCRFVEAGRPRAGIVIGDRVADAEPLLGAPAPRLEPLLALDGTRLRALRAAAADLGSRAGARGVYRLDQVTLAPPIERPGKIICVGLNYRDHALEQGSEPPAAPMIFAKYVTAILAPGAAIRLPADSAEVDYEAELCVVIGKGGYRIPEASAFDHVAGYTIINDVTARDMQRADKQFTRGKSCDTFAPLGPWLILREALPDPHRLAISLTLNGRTMQSSNTSQLIFGVPYLVSYLSRTMTLETGDLIATGTPGGVGAARKPPVFLKRGDAVAITIEGIGTLANRVE